MSQLNTAKATQTLSTWSTNPARIHAARGKLKECPARFVTDHLHKQKFTGQLLLQSRERKKKIYFHQGEIVRVQSNILQELLGHQLMERGWLREQDLNAALQKQRGDSTRRRIGIYLIENFGLTDEELTQVENEQQIMSLIQALTWDDGDYLYSEITDSKLAVADLKPIIDYGELVYSVQSLFSLIHVPLGSLFNRVQAWKTHSTRVELAQIPLWRMLAGCRDAKANGILSIRRQHQLFELVIKNGIPMVFYEGTFAQPRQRVVVRNVDEKNERQFIDEVFRLFSFISGFAYFRQLQRQTVTNALQTGTQPSELSVRSRWPVEESDGTQHVRPDEVPFELTAELLKKSQGFMKDFAEKIKERLLAKLPKK